MLRKQKSVSKANLLYFPRAEMDAVVDCLVESSIVAGSGILETPVLRGERSIDQMIHLAPSFFLCLAKALQYRSSDSSATLGPFATLCLHPFSDSQDDRSLQIQKQSLKMGWFPAMLEVLTAVEFLPEPHESHRRTEKRELTNLDGSVNQILMDLVPTEDHESPAMGNPVPEKVIDLLVEAFAYGRFDLESLRPISKLITGWTRKEAKLTLFTFDSDRTKRSLSVLQSLTRQFMAQMGMLQDRLDDKLAAMKELAYGASHEFNNPLANIATRAQTLARDEKCSDRKQQLQIINAQAFRGFDMLANLMHFASPPQTQFAACETSAVVNRAVKEVEHFFGVEMLSTLNLEIETDLPSVWADAQQLILLLKAVLRNAVEAGGPQVDIHCQRSELPGGRAAVQIQVEDRGKVIEPNLMARMCDPFFSGREAGRGLGFGLAIAYRIVQQHSGQLVLTALEPKGLQVKILLPRLESTVESADRPFF